MDAKRPLAVTVKESAELIGASVGQIRQMIRDGRLPARRVRGTRLVRIRYEDVEALLAEPVRVTRPRAKLRIVAGGEGVDS